jgi:hypothetical protein
MSVPHDAGARKRVSVFGQELRDEIREIVREETAKLTHPRLARLSNVGLTIRQRETLEREGVTFVKIAKYWMVDVSTLETYLARRRAPPEAPVCGDTANEKDPFAGVDPSVRAAFERVGRGEQ